ncbi:MAG: redoxin family protein [Patescibacteria group bacterium]
MILFILSFVAGVLTILAPCTLPLLPVIVGSSVVGEKNKKKAITIALSLGVSVIVFTFILKVSTLFISIPPEVWAVISGSIIVLFGLVNLFPELWENIPFVSRLSVDSNRILGVGYQKQSFWGDIIVGGSLGPVFSTCSPTYFVILATVLPQSLLVGTIDLLAYAVGLSGMLLVVAFLGQKIIARLGGIADSHGIFKRSLGLLFIILGIGIMFGVDKKIEASLLAHGIFDVTRIEQKLLGLQTMPNVYNSNELGFLNTNTSSTTSKNISHGPKAPEIVKPSGFINTDGKPITIGEFKGKKVILLDVWTYSCINCQRTLPYVVEWYKKYKDMGLEVIGLHTPEFAFEKVQSNVEDAIKRFGIEYPVVMDNDYATWNAYGNQYWPRKYLINSRGEIIYDHIGEGGYEETELAIQSALSELNNAPVSEPIAQPTNVVSVDPRKIASPETYFGSSRNEYLANGRQGINGSQVFTIPNSRYDNLLYLDGVWNISPEYATSKGETKIFFNYDAKNVYFVASSDIPMTITILRDGKKVNTVTISGNQLYTLIQGEDYGKHTLEIDVPKAGLNAFTFTFG